MKVLRYRPVDLARRVGLHPQTIRKYERWGFLPPAERAPNGYRLYTRRHLAALLCARALIQGYGFETAHWFMQRLHAGAVAEALARVDEIHAGLHQRRKEAEQLREALRQWRLPVAAGSGSLSVAAGGRGALRALRADRLRVGQVAAAAGVAPSALRFLEDQGLLEPIRDPESGYRLYAPEDVVRVQLIVSLRAAHYDFEAIRQVLAGLEANSPEQALRAVEQRLVELTEMSHRCLAATAALHEYLADAQGD